MPDEHENKQVASLIYWKNAEEMERILRWIKNLEEKGHVRSAITREYNEDWGHPVWYIP
jgi:hypothetical protein